MLLVKPPLAARGPRISAMVLLKSPLFWKPTVGAAKKKPAAVLSLLMLWPSDTKGEPLRLGEVAAGAVDDDGVFEGGDAAAGVDAAPWLALLLSIVS